MKIRVWVLWRAGERLHQLGVAMKGIAHRWALADKAPAGDNRHDGTDGSSA